MQTNQQTTEIPWTNEDLFSIIQNMQGKKITIVGFNMLGFPFSWPVTVYNVRQGKYAQYDNSVLIGFIPKGKMKPVYRMVNSQNDGGWIIYEGWINPDVEPFPIKTESGGKSSLASFSDEYLVTALKSVSQEPIFNNTGVS